MNPNRNVSLVSVCALVLLFSRIASADAGVPMLFVTLPAMVIALIPIILIESIVIGRFLGTSTLSKRKSVAIANVVSTLIGLPLTWVALLVLQLISGGGAAHGLVTPTQKLLAVTWQAPWLIPYEGNLNWMVPAASLFLLVPFFFVSYFIEALIIFRLNSQIPRKQIRAATFRANIVSYLLLAVFTIGWLMLTVLRGA
jgi:hypothetical protein